MEQTRYYNTSTDLARLLSREEMVILLVNWIGTRAPSETSGKKRKRTKRKSRFFSSGKIENYVRTKRMKIRVEAEMIWDEIEGSIFLFHICWRTIPHTEWTAKEMLGDVWCMACLYSLLSLSGRRGGKKWSDRSIKGSYLFSNSFTNDI